MDKCKIFKIIFFSNLFFFINQKNLLAAEENLELQNDSDEEEEDEGDFEPMNELPNIQQICPDLNKALDLSMQKNKTEKIKIYEPFLKNLNLGFELTSLFQSLWFLTSQRKSKNRSYDFDYHGRLGFVWKYNLYIGGDLGFSTSKDTVWEGGDKGKQNIKLDEKYTHLSKGFYTGVILGYNYIYNDKNNILFATKFGYSWTTIEKLKDQTFANGTVHKFNPYWIGLLISVESQFFSFPLFFGFDFQVNYLLNNKEISDLKNYLIPDYGHSEHKVNFGFNLFMNFKMNFEEEILIP